MSDIPDKEGISSSVFPGEENFQAEFTDVPIIELWSVEMLSQSVWEIVSQINAQPSPGTAIELLKHMRSLLVSGAAGYSNFDILLRSLESSLQKCLANSDDLVVREACITIGYLCEQLALRFTECALSLLPTLTLTLQCNTKEVASAVLFAMRFVFKNIPDYRLLKSLDKNITSISNIVRLACCQLLVDLLNHWPSVELAKDLTTIKRLLCNGISDADDEARVFSRQALTAFSRHFLLESEIVQKCAHVEHEDNQPRDDVRTSHVCHVADWVSHVDPRIVASELGSIRHDSEFESVPFRRLISTSSCELNFIHCEECGGEAMSVLPTKISNDTVTFGPETMVLRKQLDSLADNLHMCNANNSQLHDRYHDVLDTSNTCSQMSCATVTTCDSSNAMNNLETIEQLVFKSPEHSDVDPSSMETDYLLSEAMSSSEMATILSNHSNISEPVGVTGTLQPTADQGNTAEIPSSDVHSADKCDEIKCDEQATRCKTYVSEENSDTSMKQTTESKTIKKDFSKTDEKLFTMEFEAVPKIKVSCDEDLNRRMSEVNASLQGERSTWQDRVKALKLMRSILIAYKSDDMQLFYKLLRSVEPGLQGALKDSRPSVVREACITIMFYCRQLTTDFNHTACSLIPALCQLTANSGAPLMATASAFCMDSMIRHVRCSSLLECVASLLKSKSNSIRRQCYIMVERIMQTWSVAKLKGDMEVLKNYVSEGLRDRDAKARSISRRTFCLFARQFPEDAAILYRDIDCTNRRLLSGLVEGLNLPVTPGREVVATTTRRRPRSRTRNGATTQKSTDDSVVQTKSKKSLERDAVVRSSSAPGKATSNLKVKKSSANAVKSRGSLSKVQTTEPKTVESKKSNKCVKIQTSSRKCGSAKTCKVSNIKSTQSTDFKTSPTVTILHKNPSKESKALKKSSLKATSTDFKTYSSDANVTPVNHLSEMNVKIETLKCGRTHSEPTANTLSYENSHTEDNSLCTTNELAENTKQLNVCTESQSSEELVKKVSSEKLPPSRMIPIPTVSKIPISPMKKASSNQIINKPVEQPEPSIMAQPTEDNHEERKAGQVALCRLLYYKEKLSRVELKKVVRIFTKMFQQPHDEAFYTFLYTLSELVSTHATELADWLPNCLTSLLQCDAQLLPPSENNQQRETRQRLQECLDCVRESFPKGRQMSLLLAMILDISDVTELGNVTTAQMQQALLNYTSDLIMCMEPSEFMNSLRVQLSTAKIICWANDMTSRDVALAARTTLVGLMSLNPLEFKQIIATLPTAFQTISVRIIEEKLTDWNMYSCATPVSKVNNLDQVTHYGAQLVHSH